jgi:D-serine deaminase-like pyridoxal phosphate-dependent protein
MHPGNYALYDVTQARLGACAARHVAMRVLTRVVGHYPRSNTLLVDLGWTGASAQGKEHGYGVVRGFFDAADDGASSDVSMADAADAAALRVVNLKQEAGELSTADGSPIDYGACLASLSGWFARTPAPLVGYCLGYCWCGFYRSPGGWTWCNHPTTIR